VAKAIPLKAKFRWTSGATQYQVLLSKFTQLRV